ncbi:NAD-dependent epimerase/dehydratase family protein [Chloroflexota bacterium]
MPQNSEFSRYFVTGGAGFIGSHLVDRLLTDGNSVTVYDNLSSGKIENIEHLQGEATFQFIQADLLDSDALKEAMKGHELVYHFGANTDIPGGNRITDLDLKNDTIATYNVLKAMKQNKIEKIIFPSSSAIYGDQPSALSESIGPCLPVSLYGAGKLACEGLISSFCHLFNLQAWIFRFGNVLGARMGHGVIVDFINKLRENPKKLEVLGDGNQEKNYFLVEDCLDGILFAFHSCDNPCEVFNLGCESTIKVTAIARIVIEEMGLTDVNISYSGGKRGWPGDMPSVIYDMGKMKRMGWEAGYTSSEAIRMATRRLLDLTRE